MLCVMAVLIIPNGPGFVFFRQSKWAYTTQNIRISHDFDGYTYIEMAFIGANDIMNMNLMIIPTTFAMKTHSYAVLKGAPNNTQNSIAFHSILNRHFKYEKIFDFLSYQIAFKWNLFKFISFFIRIGFRKMFRSINTFMQTTTAVCIQVFEIK